MPSPLCGLVLVWVALVARIGAQSTQCPALMAPDCDAVVNQDIYPNQFVVYGAYAGQVYTVGNVIMVIAKFPNTTCNLPDPTTLGPACVPTMLVSLFTDVGTCYNISAASTKAIEFNFGFSFADDPSLETDSGVYNHWVFPLYVVGGMSTSRLDVKALIIPAACNSERATFANSNQISQAAHMSPPVLVDTAAPEIVSIHTGKASGVYTNGTVINIVMEFSKDVALSTLPGQFSHIYTDMKSNKIPYGIPYIPVNSNALVPLLGYASTQSKRRISFLYQVGVGEETPPGMQLDIHAGHSIALNGGSIVSYGTGLDVNLTTMPLPGSEGSLSHPTANKIYIVKTGEKFPPLFYDASENPETDLEGLGDPNLRSLETRKQAKATKVYVDLELRSLSVDDKTQGFTSEFNLITSWTDVRLKNSKAETTTDYSTQMLDSNQIWSPKLIFTNIRDPPQNMETILTVHETGKVVVVQRFVGTFAADLDMRGFPFDEQTLTWRLRSAQLDRSTVKFSPCSKEAKFNASVRLAEIPNPHFKFSDYSQRTMVLESGAYKGFDTLTIHIKATRNTSLSTIFLIFPICLICAVLCMVQFQDPNNDSRLSVPVLMIAATIVFSFVVVRVSPPVSYVTRLHLLIFQTYVLSVVVLINNYYLHTICAGRKELAEASSTNKRILKDAYWLSKNINPAPRQVIVLPGGVHKHMAAADDPPQRQSNTEIPFADVTKEFSLRMLSQREAPAIPAPAFTTVQLADNHDHREAIARSTVHNFKLEGVDLLDSEEVRALKKLSWSGPVRIFGGLAVVTNSNSEAWRAHVRFVDDVLRILLPLLSVLSASCLLGFVSTDVLSGHSFAGDDFLI